MPSLQGLVPLVSGKQGVSPHTLELGGLLDSPEGRHSAFPSAPRGALIDVCRKAPVGARGKAERLFLRSLLLDCLGHGLQLFALAGQAGVAVVGEAGDAGFYGGFV